MKFIRNKWVVIVVMPVLAIIISYYIFFGHSSAKMTESIGMGGMIIEEKHHHIEPGQYLEMWFIGYNAYEKGENRKRYKILVEDSMVYNLIKEGEQYTVSATSIREDDEYGNVYKLNQISNQEEYQLTGDGRVK